MSAARVQSTGAFFLPYQARWINDNSRLKLMEKSRQIGLSWSTAYALTRRKALADARLDAWVSSRDDIQARLFLEDCKSFAGVLNAAATDMGEMVIDADKKLSAYVLAMANGLRIHSMSSNPDAQAGKRGDRVLDEFALHPDPRKLYAIAYPGITWGGQLEIISTHRGAQNFFNRLVIEAKHEGNPKGFSLHTVTIVDAIEQGFLEKLQAKLPPDDERSSMTRDEYLQFVRDGVADEESWLQEYMCQPADESSAFISYEMISACAYPPDEPWQTDLLDAKNPLFIGVDIGREIDLTVIWVLERVANVSFTRRVIALQATTFAEQERQLYELLALPAVQRCCIDETGIGRQFAERAQERFGYKVEAVNFTGPVKETLAYPLRAAFEDRSIRIPNTQAIATDLRMIKKETTAAGNIRFAAERGKKSHADYFWALALALHAAGTNQPPGTIKPFGAHHSARDGGGMSRAEIRHSRRLVG